MKKATLLNHFTDLTDPRSHINRLHEFNDILLIGIIAVICGAETWKQMEEFAYSKEKFLRKFLLLPNGIPSDDTINRLFSAIEPKEFEQCFTRWAATLPDGFTRQVFAIDGKTVRGAKSHGVKSPVHIVSAWASEHNIVVGQVKVEDKSNEITAIPELLETLCVEGGIVTIDAMETDIAEKIIEKGADYILAVKENQKTLSEQVQDEFKLGKPADVHTDVDFGHGRIETRICSVIPDFQFVDNSDQRWKNLQQIIKIESKREFKNSDKAAETETRYYISSFVDTAENCQKHIRSHWGIENKLHWILDVAFHEDQSRKRAGNAAQNYSLAQKLALNLLKNDKTTKQGVAGKRLKAAWNETYLKQLLNIKV